MQSIGASDRGCKMQYTSYYDAEQAAKILRQVTGLTYIPLMQKPGSYHLRANLAYPVAPREESGVHLARSIVPENQSLQTNKPNNDATNNQTRQPTQNQQSRIDAVNGRAVQSGKVSADAAPTANTRSINLAVQDVAVETTVTTKSVPTVGNGTNLAAGSPIPSAPLTRDQTATAQNSPAGQALPSPAPSLPIGRVAVPVAFPLYQAGGGVGGGTGGAPLPLNNFDTGGTVRGTQSANAAASSRFSYDFGSAGGDNFGAAFLVSSANSRTGLIIDRVAG